MQTRLAGTEDAGTLARMLHDFNTEFGEPTPGTATLESRVTRFIGSGEKIYLLGGPGPDGFAQVSFNSSIWSEGPIVLIEELYVIPDLRRQGMGRALMEATLELARERGADGAEVITGEDDTGARALYEAFGFRNEVKGEENARSLFYELEL